MPNMRFELTEVETLQNAKCKVTIMIHNQPAGLLFEDVVDFLQTIVSAANEGLSEHQGTIFGEIGNLRSNSGDEHVIRNLETIHVFYPPDKE